MKADFFGRARVDLLVVEEEGFIGANAKMVAGPCEDGWVGFGNAQLAGIGLMVKMREPGELLTHGAQDLRHHVGEDGGIEARLLQRGGPGEHALIDGDPHQDIVLDKGGDLFRREGSAGILAEFRPVRGTVEIAEVVVVAIAPVKRLEGLQIKACHIEEAAVGGGVLGTEDIAIVEDDGANR